MWNRKKVLLSGLFFLLSLAGFSQQKTGTVDIFMGVDFNYRDIYWNNRVYDILVIDIWWATALSIGKLNIGYP